MLACSIIFLPLQQAYASPTEITARPPTTDIVDWGQLGTPNLTFTTPQYFTSSSGDILGTVYANPTIFLGEQCCIGTTGTVNGGFARGDKVLATYGPITIKFYEPVQSVGAQIQDGNVGDHFTAVILAFNGDTLLGAFTESGFSNDTGNNDNVFLVVEDSTGSITEIVYLIINPSDPTKLQGVIINQLTVVTAPKHSGHGK
jgi:hypothetical protein